jgi:lipoprotein signal peptidase
MNSTQKGVRFIPRLLTIILFVSADYASKVLVQSNLSPDERIPLIGNVFSITYVQNYSGFSWFVPHMPTWVQISFQAFLFLLAIIAFPVYLFYTCRRRHTLWTDVTFVCLVSSFLGHSVVDIFFPYTVDFLQIFRSPSANFADLYSYVGIGALLIELAQVYSLKEHRWKGLHQQLVDGANTQKEFFDFIRRGFK